MIKKYTNGNVTILWKPDLCIHSANCVRSLPGVFKPQERPWLQPENASEEELIKAVLACPSGALSLETSEPTPSAESSSASRVKILANGPVRVTGPCEVTLADGTVVVKPNGVSFCRCGGTSNPPFCDGTHKSNGYQG